MVLPDFLEQDAAGFIHFAGHRVGLQDVVHFYKEGCSAEELCEILPTLPLALIHKAIACYLENTADIDEYLARCDDEIERQRGAASRGPDVVELRRRIAARHMSGA